MSRNTVRSREQLIRQHFEFYVPSFPENLAGDWIDCEIVVRIGSRGIGTAAAAAIQPVFAFEALFFRALQIIHALVGKLRIA